MDRLSSQRNATSFLGPGLNFLLLSDPSVQSCSCQCTLICLCNILLFEKICFHAGNFYSSQVLKLVRRFYQQAAFGSLHNFWNGNQTIGEMFSCQIQLESLESHVLSLQNYYGHHYRPSCLTFVCVCVCVYVFLLYIILGKYKII